MGNDAEKKLEPPKLGLWRKKAKDEPAQPDPAHPDPVQADSVQADPGHADAGQADAAGHDAAESGDTLVLEPAPDDEPTAVVPMSGEPAEPERTTKTLKRAEAKPAKAKPAKATPAKTRPTKARKERPERPSRVPAEVPISDGPLAAALVGLVVGLFLVAAVWVCEQLSQQARGTTSLGNAGFPLLLGIFILAVVIGTLLLRLAKTPSPGSVSFLGTGLVAVIAMLFLGDHSDTLVGAVVVVVLAVAAFLLSRWVTVRYIDAG